MVWRSKHCLTQEKVQAYSAVLHFYQINSCLLYCAVSVADYSAQVSICVLTCTVNFHFSIIPSPLLYPTWRLETGIWFTLAWPSQLLTWSIFGFSLAFQNLFGDYRRQARSLLTGFVYMRFVYAGRVLGSLQGGPDKRARQGAKESGQVFSPHEKSDMGNSRLA